MVRCAENYWCAKLCSSFHRAAARRAGLETWKSILSKILQSTKYLLQPEALFLVLVDHGIELLAIECCGHFVVVMHLSDRVDASLGGHVHIYAALSDNLRFL